MKLKQYKLGDFCQMKYGKMPPRNVLSDEGFPVFSGYRITGYAKEYLWDESRVIVVARGVGGTGDVKISPEKAWITNLSIVLEHDSRIVDKLFLFYRLGLEPLKDKLNTGAAQAQITINSLKPYLLALPDLGIQIRIASILATYDDLIENNLRRIQLLEQAARLLYKEWFVYHRFPGHEHTRLINGVPEGWEQKILGEICTNIRESVLPEQLEPDTPYIGLEHMPRRSIALTEWATAEAVTSTKHRYKDGDILFGKIRPYFHKVGIAFTDGIASSDAIVIRPDAEDVHSFVLMTVASDEFVAEASQTMREGSKMPRADWKLMTKYPVSLPPHSLLENFTETVTAITDQLRNLCFQNQKLKAARDLLLPRLINGEIAV